jgi:hypothetical protein
MMLEVKNGGENVPVNMAVAAQLPILNSQIEKNLQAMVELHGLFTSLVHYRSKYAKKLLLAISNKVGQLDDAVGETPSTTGLAILQIKDNVIEEAGFLEREAKQVEVNIMGDILKLHEESKNEKKEIEGEFDKKKKVLENAKLQVAKRRKDCFMLYESIYNTSLKIQEAKNAIPKEANPQKRDILVGSIAKNEAIIRKNAVEAKKAFQELERLVIDVNQRYRVFYGEEVPDFMEKLRRMDEKRAERLKDILQKYANLTTESMKTVLDRRKKMDEMIKKVVSLEDSMLYVAENAKVPVIPELPVLSPDLPVDSNQIENRVERMLNGEANLSPLGPVERSSASGGFLSTIASMFNSGPKGGAPPSRPPANDRTPQGTPQGSPALFAKADSSEDHKNFPKLAPENKGQDGSDDDSEPSKPIDPMKSAASIATTISTQISKNVEPGPKGAAPSGPGVKNLMLKPNVEVKKPAPQIPTKSVAVQERLTSIGGPTIVVDEKVAEMMKLPPPPPPPEEEEDSGRSQASNSISQRNDRFQGSQKVLAKNMTAEGSRSFKQVDFGASMEEMGSSGIVRASFAVLKDAIAIESSEEHLAEDGSVLEFQIGDLIVITDQTDDFWWGGYLKQDENDTPEAKWFPSDLVKLL